LGFGIVQLDLKNLQKSTVAGFVAAEWVEGVGTFLVEEDVFKAFCVENPGIDILDIVCPVAYFTGILSDREVVVGDEIDGRSDSQCVYDDRDGGDSKDKGCYQKAFNKIVVDIEWGFQGLLSCTKDLGYFSPLLAV
jgi:hypothetical protein